MFPIYSKWISLHLLTIICFTYIPTANVQSQEETGSNSDHYNYYALFLLHYHFEDTKVYNQMAHAILIIVLLKLLYVICNKFSRHIPESGIFVIIGIVISVAELYIGHATSLYSSDAFFYFVLPLIIIDAGFYFPVRSVINNLCPVFYFAFIGTILNAILLAIIIIAFKKIGCKSYPDWCAKAFEEMTVVHALLYSVVISAVDPVAVLALFEHANINPQLHTLVFGESLLNDAVVIILFSILKTISLRKSTIVNYGNIIGAGIIKFGLSTIVGSLIGSIIGIFGIILSKYTYYLPIVEPISMYTTIYIAYIISESLHFSAIFSAITAAIVMKPYIIRNMSSRSVSALNYLVQILRHVAEDGVFILIGIVNVYELKVGSIDYAFVALIIVSSLLVRFAIVFGSGLVINKFFSQSGKEISMRNLFIVSYGGLRGAISLSLSFDMMKNVFGYPGANPKLTFLGYIFNNTTMIFVIVTILIQGTTMKFFIALFKVKKAPKSIYPLFDGLNDSIIEDLIESFTAITKCSDTACTQRFERIDNKVFRRLFLINHDLSKRQEKVVNIFNKFPEEIAKSANETNQTNAQIYKDAYIKLRNNRKETVTVAQKDIDDDLGRELENNRRFQRIKSIRKSFIAD